MERAAVQAHLEKKKSSFYTEYFECDNIQQMFKLDIYIYIYVLKSWIGWRGKV